MPHLVVSWDNQLIEKRALARALVVGRSSECDIVIRDVHLSRRHCKIEACPSGWCVVDMDSKNGMLVNGQRTIRHELSEGDLLRMGKEGRLRIQFREAPLPAEDRCLTLASPVRFRPADPGDTMDGTVAGFTLLEPGEGVGSDVDETGEFPSPQPQPRTPAAYERDDVARMISALVSSSWDSIYEQARQKSRPRPAIATEKERPAVRRRRPEQPVDFSLQVQSDGQSETAAVTTTVDSPMRLRAATSPGTRIATGSKSTQVAEPTGIDAAEVDVVVERRFAEAGSPAGDQWPTESPGEERDQIAAVARPPSPVVETTRSLPTPQPRDWKELIADPRTLGGVAAAIGFLLIGMSAWHLLRPDSARDPSHHVQSLVTNSALIEPRPAHAASPKTTVLLPEDIATAASATPVTAVAAPPAASDASASSAALSAAGLAAPESAAGDSRSSQPLFFANDLRLGLADPFGPILDAAAKSSPPESTGSSPAGLDVTASLGSDLSPVTPAVVSSEPPR